MVFVCEYYVETRQHYIFNNFIYIKKEIKNCTVFNSMSETHFLNVNLTITARVVLFIRVVFDSCLFSYLSLS